jgi:hypothetical protein
VRSDTESEDWRMERSSSETDDPYKESDVALMRGCFTFFLIGAAALGLLLGFAATLEEENPVGMPDQGHLAASLMVNSVTVLLASGAAWASRKWFSRALSLLILATVLYRTVHVWNLIA